MFNVLKAKEPVVRRHELSRPEALPNLHGRLRDGAQLHAFLSGGGLRVVRLEHEGKLLGYGEHPYIEEALLHADEDAAAGQRPYGEVYGKIYDHYYTGASVPSGPLDAWVRAGQTFSVIFGSGGYQARLKSIEETRVPNDVQERVRRTLQSETFTNRGYKYLVSPRRFADGSLGVTAKVIHTNQSGRNDAWMWDASRTGYGATIIEALANGLKAPPVEIKDTKGEF